MRRTEATPCQPPRTRAAQPQAQPSHTTPRTPPRAPRRSHAEQHCPRARLPHHGNQRRTETPRHGKPQRKPPRAGRATAREGAKGGARIMTKSALRKMAGRRGTYGAAEGHVWQGERARLGRQNVTYGQAVDSQRVAQGDEGRAQGGGKAERRGARGGRQEEDGGGERRTGGRKKVAKSGRGGAGGKRREKEPGRGRECPAEGAAGQEEGAGARFSPYLFGCVGRKL